MASWLKQSTAVTIRLGPLLDIADGVTEETGQTPAVEVSKNHAAFASRNSATAVAHDSNGWYSIPLDTTDTGTLGPLIVKTDAAATYLPVWREFMVVPANTYDSLIAGSDVLTADVTQIAGTTANATKLGYGTSSIVLGTVTGASSTTTSVVTSDLSNTVANDFYKDRWCLFISGNLAGQAKLITAYTAATRTLTVSTLTAAPTAADTLIIV
jgi:hypothetical protein